MYENIEKWIRAGARPYVAMGIFVAAAAITGILAIVSLIAAFWSAWWLLAFAVCGTLCGTLIGASLWLWDVAF